jgi:EAL domain-containing protein (putative c-di-GMP-specific phosphodiesterase class I)
VVKIDRSFIETIGHPTEQLALVEGIVRPAGTLGLQVIAEGVGSEIDRDLLLKVRCPLGRGYLYSRPMSYPDTLSWLRDQRVAA